MTDHATLSLPKDKADLMNRIQREWSALLHTVENLNHEQMTRPGPGGWSVKDNLAHLAEWERFVLLNQFQGHPPHEALQVDLAMLEEPDEDELNSILFERNRERSLLDVLADLHHTHAQLLTALEQTPEGDLAKPSYGIGPEARPLMLWVIYNTYEHYDEHRRTIETMQSVSFIEERGSDLEKARTRHILFGEKPEPEVVRAFVELQNPDGGFPCGMVQGNLSAVHKTLNGVWWLDELGMLESPTADRAFGYLLELQRDDGGWDEDPAIEQYDLPPWIGPADLRTRVYLSSYAAYWLAVRGYNGHAAFRAALQFLVRHRDETGRFYGFPHSTWIATSVFIMAGRKDEKGHEEEGDEYAEVVEQGLQVLTDRPLPEWPVEHICWALNYLGRAGLSREHPLIKQGLAELLQRRGSDGSWTSAEDDPGAVTTMQALKVLKHYGLV